MFVPILQRKKDIKINLQRQLKPNFKTWFEAVIAKTKYILWLRNDMWSAIFKPRLGYY